MFILHYRDKSWLIFKPKNETMIFKIKPYVKTKVKMAGFIKFFIFFTKHIFFINLIIHFILIFSRKSISKIYTSFKCHIPIIT